MGHADSKRQRMEYLENLLLHFHLTPTEMAEKIGCDRTTIHDYLNEMARTCPLMNDGKGCYELVGELIFSSQPTQRN